MYVTSAGVGEYVSGEEHVGMFGRLYKPSQNKRAVLSPHGSGGTGASWVFSDSNGQPLMRALADGGYPAISADYGGGNTWGNDASRTTVGQVWTFVQTRFGCKSDKMLLVGGSMGALTAVNYARQNPTKVAALALFIPITDLADAHDSRGFSSVINTAYGGSSGYTAALAAHSPILNAADVISIPIRMWYSTDDPYAVPATVTAYQTAVNNAGGNASIVSMGAQGHALDAASPKTIADWLAQYA